MTNTFEHFADHVPQDIREHLKALAEYVAEELTSFKNSESSGEAQLSEIWGKDPGGFIPFQLGGFEASVLIRHDTDSGYHLTQDMTDVANSQQEDCLQCFLQEVGKASYDDLTDEEREELFNQECEWMEPALLRFESWLAGDPYPETEQEKELGEVNLLLSVNGRDAPYYRKRSDEAMHALELSVDVLREAVKRWPDDWQARLWRQLLKSDANNEKEAIGGLDNVD